MAAGIVENSAGSQQAHATFQPISAEKAKLWLAMLWIAASSVMYGPAMKHAE